MKTAPPLKPETIESTIKDCPAETIDALAQAVLQGSPKAFHSYLLLSRHLPSTYIPRVLKSLARYKDPYVLHRPHWHAPIPVEHVAAFRGPHTCQLLIHLHRAVLLGITPASCLPDLITQRAQLFPHLLCPDADMDNQLAELRSLQETLALGNEQALTQARNNLSAEPHDDTYCVCSEARGRNGYFRIERFRLRSTPHTDGDLSECSSIRIELKSRFPCNAPVIIHFSIPDALTFNARLTALLHPGSKSTPTT